MIPAAFDYTRAASTDEALAALAEHGDDAKLLAGGHSLLPLMKLRLAQPELLVDIGRLEELRGIRDAGDHVAIGALTRHRDVETSELLAAQVAILPAATAQVGDPQVRHRGTIGGSIAHADPASDLPAVLLALDATLVARSAARGERQIAMRDFFTGFLESTLEPDELLTEIRVPKCPGAGWSFHKFNRRAQDWAIVGVAAVHNGRTGVGLVNMASVPLVARAVEAAVAEGASAADAAELACDGAEPAADLNATVEYRSHLARVLVRRALIEAGVG
ncbi:MAG: FAD binding domain-containing protein [Acidimicrobiales bacterium]